jgi:hypothetical protein
VVLFLILGKQIVDDFINVISKIAFQQVILILGQDFARNAMAPCTVSTGRNALDIDHYKIKECKYLFIVACNNIIMVLRSPKPDDLFAGRSI